MSKIYNISHFKVNLDAVPEADRQRVFQTLVEITGALDTAIVLTITKYGQIVG